MDVLHIDVLIQIELAVGRVDAVDPAHVLVVAVVPGDAADADVIGLLVLEGRQDGRSFAGNDVGVDADDRQVFLQDLSDLDIPVVGAGDHVDLAIEPVGISGFGQQRLSFFEILGVEFSRLHSAGDQDGADHVVGHIGETLRGDCDHVILVHAVTDGLAHTDIIEGAVLFGYVEAHEGGLLAGGLGGVVLAAGLDHLPVCRIDGAEIELAALKSDQLRGVVQHGYEFHGLNGSFAEIVLGEGFQRDLGGLVEVFHAVGARASVIRGHTIGVSKLFDHVFVQDHQVSKSGGECGIRRFQSDFDRVIVDDINLVNITERVAVVEYDALAQGEGILQAIRADLIFLGQARFQHTIVIETEQAFIHLRGDLKVHQQGGRMGVQGASDGGQRDLHVRPGRRALCLRFCLGFCFRFRACGCG